MKAGHKSEMPPLVRLVDDEPEVLRALEYALISEEIESACFTGGRDFLEHEAPERPGCAILDIRMPGMTGTELFAELIRRGYPHPVIFLSGHGDIGIAVECVKKGAFDFLQKPTDMKLLVQTAQKAIAFDRAPLALPQAECMRLVAKLSERERPIVRLLLEELPHAFIAERLGLSVRTVEAHRAAAYLKLGVRSLEELALRLGEVKSYL